MPHRALLLAVLAVPVPALATDIFGTLPASLDQPRINALLERPAGGGPLTADFGGVDTFNIQAFFDTGASGIVMSQNTADFLGVSRLDFNGQLAVYSDVGVGGTSDYNVSELLDIRLASYNPLADVDNLATYTSVYNTQFAGMRAQIGPLNADTSNPILADLDVFGIPLMQNKVVVMDPKPVNTFLDTMRTYVYDPGTPFNAATASTNPGIPMTDRHVRLSYGDFKRFTTLEPAGASAPSFEDNPFIGPNPVLALDPGSPPDDTPGVKLSYGGASIETSLLFDTGAATNIISEGTAAALGVTYDPNSTADNPKLLNVPEELQFQLTVGGTGGTKKVAGFFLDSALVRTQEGNAADDVDPNHLNYQLWPTLVFDITVEDPVTSDTLTLDGIFGMNNLVASAFLIETADFPVIGGLSRGSFDWLTFDEANGTLGLTFAPPTPQAELTWFGEFGGNGNDWDVGASPFWFDETQFTFVPFEQGDRVLFSTAAFFDEIEIKQAVTPGGVTVNNGPDLTYRFYGQGKITGLTGLTKLGDGTLRIETRNDYTGATDIQAGTIDFAAPQNIGPVLVRAGGNAIFRTSQRFEALSVVGTAQVTAGGNKVIAVENLNVTGSFDLADQKLLLDVEPGETPPLEAVRLMLAGGHLTSSALAGGRRLGYATGATALGFTGDFFGVAYGDEDVLILSVLGGDATLDGVVNLLDFNRLAASFGTSGHWEDGDFNYDGVINLLDFNALAANFGQNAPLGTSIQTLWDAAAAANVPEPSGLLLAAGLAAPALRRRRR